MHHFRLIKTSAVFALTFAILANVAGAQQELSVDDIVGALRNGGAAKNEADAPVSPESPDQPDAPKEKTQPDAPATEAPATEAPVTEAPVEKDDGYNAGADAIASVTDTTSLAQIDLQVQFASNSDNIDSASFKQLITLATALSDANLADQRILIAGHTDAKGSDEHNLQLSQRRATAVLEFITRVDPELAPRLEAKGFGESQLKNPDDPEAAENRRVQIVNLGR